MWDSPHHPRGADAVVLLHEGLGSIGQWRDLPAEIATRTGLTVVAYDRAGHGRSTPGPPTHVPEFMHHEARDVVPAVLDHLDIAAPVLVGHSDGASIALISAGEHTSLPAAVCAIAPHVFVEDVCLSGIRAIADQRDRVVAGLARYHDNPDLAFDRWRDVWLSPAFGDWNITALLPDIACPVVAVQGDQDEYATDAMLSAIATMVPDARASLIPACGHVAHRDQPAAVLGAIATAVELAEVSTQ